MNIPKNFKKIDGKQFTVNNQKFTIEVDHNEIGDCWVVNHMDNPWPMCFDIDWINETYTLTKCRPGAGRSGDKLVTHAPLVKFLMKDADSFVNSFIKDIVWSLINNNLI